MFDAMGQEGRSLVLRKIFMHFLRKFPTDFDNLNAADEYIRKTLNLWKLFVGLKFDHRIGAAVLGKMQQNNGDSCHIGEDRRQLCGLLSVLSNFGRIDDRRRSNGYGRPIQDLQKMRRTLWLEHRSSI